MDRLLLSRWFSPLLMLAAALVVLAIYSNSFTAAFQFDDLPTIQDNRNIRDLGNLPRIVQSTRGLTMATFALNYAVGGLDVRGYHAVNIAVHVVNACLAYLLLLATFRLAGAGEAASRRLAALAALIFAAHPVQTQSVTYIVQRMESMASLFYMAALLALIYSSMAATALKRWTLWAGVGASYLLAFYSKEIAYTLPAAALLYDLCFLSKGSARQLLGRWPVYALLAVLFAAFTYTTVVPLGGFNDLSQESAAEQARFAAPKVKAGLGQGARELDYTAGFKVSQVSPREYLYTQFNAMVYYLALLAVPTNQNLDYDFPWARELLAAPAAPPGTVLNYPLPPPIVSLAILVAIAGAAAFMLLKTRGNPSRATVAGFFMLWYFIILAPTSSIVPIVDAMYEHRLYLPSLGVFAVFVIAVDSLFRAAFSVRSGARAL